MTEFKVGDTVKWNYNGDVGTITGVDDGEIEVDWGTGHGGTVLYTQSMMSSHTTKVVENNPIEPNHYQRNGVNFIEFIEHMPGNRFNAMKYIYRAGVKNPETLLEDLKKAQWSLNREIERLERG